MKCNHPEEFLLALFERVTERCCNGTEEDGAAELTSYFEACADCYERVAQACRMSGHVFRRNKLREHARICADISRLAQDKMRLATRYRKQMASLLSFGENAVFHLDWHHNKLAKLDERRDEILHRQAMIRADLFMLVQLTQFDEDENNYEEDDHAAAAA